MDYKNLHKQVVEQEHQTKSDNNIPTSIGLHPKDLIDVKNELSEFAKNNELQLNGLPIKTTSVIEQGNAIVYYNAGLDGKLCKPNPEKIEEFVKDNVKIASSREIELARKVFQAEIALPFAIKKVEYKFTDDAKEIVDKENVIFRGKVEDRTEQKDSDKMPVERFGLKQIMTFEALENLNINFEEDFKTDAENKMSKRLDEAIADGFVEYDITASEFDNDGNLVKNHKIGEKRKFFDKLLLESKD